MNLFKKIFGKKDESVSEKSLEIDEKEILKEIADNIIEDYTKSFVESLENIDPTENIELYKPKHYKIPSVVKTAKAKLKSDGIQGCIDYINSILDDTEQLQKDQSISLTRNFVKILKSNKHESLNDIDMFLESCLSKYSVLQDPMFYGSIAEIYSEIDTDLTLNYISKKNIELENNEIFKSLNYYLHIDKIKILIQTDSLVIAKQEIDVTDKLIENNTWFQFLSDKTKVLYLCSQIASKNKDFKQTLKYEVLLFLLETAKDLSGFPITLNGFLHRKNLALNGEYGLDYDSIIEDFTEDVLPKNDFEKLQAEIYQFAYTDMPNRIGINSEYLEKNYTTEELNETFGNQWYMKFNKITNAPFEHFVFIETFVDKTLKNLVK